MSLRCTVISCAPALRDGQPQVYTTLLRHESSVVHRWVEHRGRGRDPHACSSRSVLRPPHTGLGLVEDGERRWARGAWWRALPPALPPGAPPLDSRHELLDAII